MDIPYDNTRDGIFAIESGVDKQDKHDAAETKGINGKVFVKKAFLGGIIEKYKRFFEETA